VCDATTAANSAIRVGLEDIAGDFVTEGCWTEQADTVVYHGYLDTYAFAVPP
jgi:hypothetical protein